MKKHKLKNEEEKTNPVEKKIKNKAKMKKNKLIRNEETKTS